jgi:hypothetical protein
MAYLIFKLRIYFFAKLCPKSPLKLRTGETLAQPIIPGEVFAKFLVGVNPTVANDILS